MSGYIGINHDIRNVNGAHIEMPPWYGGETGWGNLEMPNPHLLASTATYPCGTKFVEGDRTWIYAHYRGTIHSANPQTVLDQDCAVKMMGKGLLSHSYQYDYAAGYCRSLAGSKTIILAVTDTGDNMEDMEADNAYSGGWILTNDSAAGDDQLQCFRIIESTYSATTATIAEASMATPTTLTVDHTTSVAHSATAVASVMPNMWKHIVWLDDNAYASWLPILGASMVGNITGAGYMWLQTYGPMGTKHLGTLPGDGVSEAEMKWMSNGSMDTAATRNDYQTAGFVMFNSAAYDGSATSEGYPMVFLTMQR